MLIDINTFGGIAPRFDRTKLPGTLAQEAFNCDISSGSLELFNGISAADCDGGTPSPPDPKKTAVPNPPSVSAVSLLDFKDIEIEGCLQRGAFGGGGICRWYDDPVRRPKSNARLTYTRTAFTDYGADVVMFSTTWNGHDYEGQISWSGLIRSGLISRYRVKLNNEWYPTTETSRDWVMGYTWDVYSPNDASSLLGRATLKSANDYFVVTQDWSNPDSSATGITYYTIPSSREVVFKFDIKFAVTHMRSYSYRVTFSDANGNEGEPSEATEEITSKEGETVELTFQGIKTEGDETPSKINIYRSDGGTGINYYYYLDTVDYETKTYKDYYIDNSRLGRQLPYYNGFVPPVPMWGNPPDDMTEVIQMPSMFYVGFKEKTLYFSDVRLYNYRWPDAFKIEFNYDILKIMAIGNVCVVFTKGAVYGVYGNRPYEHWAKELSSRCCVSGDGVAKLNEVAYYITPDGLMKTNGYNASLISGQFFMPKDWRNLTPLTMTLEQQGDRLFVYTADSSAYNYIFQFDVKGLSVLQTDRTTPTFEATEMLWESREYTFNKPTTFNYARVLAESYTGVILYIYRNNVLIYQKEVLDNQAFSLSRFDPHKNWTVKVKAKERVHRISLAQGMDEFNQGG